MTHVTRHMSEARGGAGTPPPSSFYLKTPGETHVTSQCECVTSDPRSGLPLCSQASRRSLHAAWGGEGVACVRACYLWLFNSNNKIKQYFHLTSPRRTEARQQPCAGQLSLCGSAVRQRACRVVGPGADGGASCGGRDGLDVWSAPQTSSSSCCSRCCPCAPLGQVTAHLLR